MNPFIDPQRGIKRSKATSIEGKLPCLHFFFFILCFLIAIEQMQQNPSIEHAVNVYMIYRIFDTLFRMHGCIRKLYVFMYMPA